MATKVFKHLQKEELTLTLVEEFSSMNEAVLLQASLSQFLGAPGIPEFVARLPLISATVLRGFFSVSVSLLSCVL